ncbi:unnamed protein product [Didymodactylos carnosus]|uniref:Uncharacterized protein n=1 Tax=Didymodactylos carnosus TaxID=1234261 RepID=A0A8S2FMM4_9BILA|nr:unnamed protein product [Didymodactylos carnosus]CAF4287134.1 unnamed protein product [Didymodactylos carnosus]
MARPASGVYDQRVQPTPVGTVAVPEWSLDETVASKYAALFPHVSSRGKELLHILVHGAANLPMVEGRMPRSYVTVQSIQTMATQEIGGTY